LNYWTFFIFSISKKINLKYFVKLQQDSHKDNPTVGLPLSPQLATITFHPHNLHLGVASLNFQFLALNHPHPSFPSPMWWKFDIQASTHTKVNENIRPYENLPSHPIPCLFM